MRKVAFAWSGCNPQAVEEDDEVGGYIVDRFIPAGAFTIVGGVKVGKTSLIQRLRSCIAERRRCEGLETIPVSHLTIFSDDQKATVTGSFVRPSMALVSLKRNASSALATGCIFIRA